MSEETLCKLPVEGYPDLFLLSTVYNGGQDGIDLAVSDGRQQAWTGTVTGEALAEQCREFEMEFEDYLQETCKALTRRNVGNLMFEYETEHTGAGALQLVWKKHIAREKIKFQLGVVTLEAVEDINEVTKKIFDHGINISSTLRLQISHLEADNDRLASERAGALKRLEKCVAAKEELERNMFAKFATVVNDKKTKIRKLKIELERVANGTTVSHTGVGRNDPASNVDTDGEMGNLKRDTTSDESDDYNTDEEAGAPQQHKRLKRDLKSQQDAYADDMLDDTDETPAANRSVPRLMDLQVKPLKAPLLTEPKPPPQAPTMSGGIPQLMALPNPVVNPHRREPQPQPHWWREPMPLHVRYPDPRWRDPAGYNWKAPPSVEREEMYPVKAGHPEGYRHPEEYPWDFVETY